MNGYVLIFPFLPVVSRGGPFADDAYAAGWEMGKIDAQLAAAATLEICTVGYTVRRANRDQVDLVAMSHGFVVAEIDMGDDVDDALRADWCWLSVTRSPERIPS